MPKIRPIGKTGGRKKGVLNKATRAIKEIAEPFGEAAVGVLAAIMTDPLAPHPARVQAASALLDRGFGRPHATSDVTVTETQHYVRAPSKLEPQEWQDLLQRRQSAAELIESKPQKPAPVLPAASPRKSNLAGVNKIN